MTRQNTLFPEPEPERHGPISEPLDPNVMYLAVLGMISSGREFRKHYAAMKKQREDGQ